MDISVICITYNHINYIKSCIESILIQKTNYSFEIIIHDDASYDGTAEIVKYFQRKFPDKIFPTFQKNNQFSQGVDIFKNFIFPKVRGKYVAICEGDDYWTDPYKLEKQANFLEAHPEASICFHPVTVHWDNNIYPDTEFPSPQLRFNKKILNVSDLLKHNFIQTNSVMYRWIFHKSAFSIFPDNILPCDWYLHLLHAQTGNIIFINENMSVYRKHSKSIWYECMESPRWYKNCGIQHYNFYEEVEKRFGINFSNEKETIIACSCIYALISYDTKWFSRLQKYLPGYINNKYLLLKFLLKKGLKNVVSGYKQYLIKKIMLLSNKFYSRFLKN